MATIYPFRALRPGPNLAAQVASVPYDVVDRSEAALLAEGNDKSFLHVTKPEIDLPADVDGHSEAVYQQGAKALQQLIADGTLVRDDAPCLYIYALTMNGHTQTGVVMLASVDEYDQNIVRKHEYTRPDKENDRVHHMEILGAQSGTVFLSHRDSPQLAEQVSHVTAEAAAADFTATDGIRHQAWVVSDPAAISAITAGFAAAGPIYIADGHHRSAAASRVAAALRKAGSPAAESAKGFLSVSFPASELRILPYNRVVKDLGEHSAASLLTQVRERFDVTEGKPEPIAPKQFGMYLAERWYTLTCRADSFDAADPVGRLDVSILQAQLLAPLLAIGNPRTDTRIDFVGGIRGDAELEKRVNGGAAVAFKMHATSMDELLAIADAEEVMPPKSTWFEPKLRDGLFVHVLD